MRKIDPGKVIAILGGALGILSIFIPDRSGEEEYRKIAREEANKILADQKRN